jgi:flagellar biosynthesis protein FlhG
MVSQKVFELHGRRSDPPLTVSVTSGKGGVGKTLTTVNLAVAARRLGYRVLILDGDLGLANVDVVLGLQAKHNIRDVLDGHASLTDIIVEGPLGIRVIPAGSGITRLANLSSVQRIQLDDHIAALKADYDVLLIDTGAGISESVMGFNEAADKIVVVTTPEPHAMTDAYAMIKVLAEEKGRKSVGLLVNQAAVPGDGLKVHERISEVSRRFLNAKVEYLGHIPFDPQVGKSVMRRQAASEQSTYTLAGQAWTQVAHRIFLDRPAAVQATSHDPLQKVLWGSLARAEAF